MWNKLPNNPGLAQKTSFAEAMNWGDMTPVWFNIALLCVNQI